jgi:cystathionine beta-synthase
VREAYTLFAGGQTAVAVTGGNGLRGVISKSDLMEFWAHAGRSGAAIKGGSKA